MSKDLRNTLLAAVFFVLVCSGIGYWAYDVNTELEQVTQENAGLQAAIDELQKAASPKVIELLQKELDDIEKNFKEYVKILPSEDVATEENLLRAVQKYVTESNVTYSDYTSRRAGGKAEFEELAVSLRCEGTFDQFVSFLNLLERHESFLRVNSFSASVSKTVLAASGAGGNFGGGRDILTLGLNIEISTYRYIPKK